MGSRLCPGLRLPLWKPLLCRLWLSDGRSAASSGCLQHSGDFFHNVNWCDSVLWSCRQTKSRVEVEDHLLHAGKYTQYMEPMEWNSFIDLQSSLDDLVDLDSPCCLTKDSISTSWLDRQIIIFLWEIWAGSTEGTAEFEDRRAFVDLMKQQLHLDWKQRISPHQALHHLHVTMSHLTATRSIDGVSDSYSYDKDPSCRVFWWKPKTNMKMYRDLLVTLESCWRGFVGCSVLCVAAGAQLWRTDYLLFLTSHSYFVKCNKYNWLQLDCSGEYYITQSFSGLYSFKRNFLRNTVEASVGSALHELKLFRKSMKKNKLSRFLSG